MDQQRLRVLERAALENAIRIRQASADRVGQFRVLSQD
jgi:hypothetical protein